MQKAILLAGFGLLLAAAPVWAAEPASNPEMQRIFDADQADRSGDVTQADWSVIGPRDAQRREATRRLLAEGQLHTGDDFLQAAFVFQHGGGDDFLLAHTLAVVATKKGAKGGPWIAAATLDRYLQNTKHKQIYGTQSLFANGTWTKAPYDRDLISDALRLELGVPDLAAQDAELDARKAQAVPAAAPLPAVPAGQALLRCASGPIERVFVRAAWQIQSCDNGALVVTSGAPPAVLFVMVQGDKVVVTPSQGGGDPAEVKVATAAFEAMTAAQIADIVAQTKP
ncbi:hypothetical protein ABAC460_20330 [Asticcacaulis sp. AC460]|uniref:hypothetical protein n=1 Tax=Asticcacaulis sp. AC460 TaxID=1282360 RepID=UPI0003C4002F|nr:hypothetical protein [Asticcacaulis sp. AC460]ESQ87373.1 hypothetical protein ABAC460_20330 [Asticcacaulis sp. AC460]